MREGWGPRHPASPSCQYSPGALPSPPCRTRSSVAVTSGGIPVPETSRQFNTQRRQQTGRVARGTRLWCSSRCRLAPAGAVPTRRLPTRRHHRHDRRAAVSVLGRRRHRQRLAASSSPRPRGARRLVATLGVHCPPGSAGGRVATSRTTWRRRLTASGVSSPPLKRLALRIPRVDVSRRRGPLLHGR